jgi:hypothetical protein
MGWSCSWIAVRGEKPDSILQTLALRRPGFFELPDNSWACAALPSDWFVIFAQRYPAEFNDRTFGELSSRGELLVSCLEEHAMYSSAAYWKDGKQVWSVVHDAQEGADHLVATGELPSSYSAMRDDFLKSQENAEEKGEGIDYLFDLPLELGAELTDFRHDDGGLKSLVSSAGARKKSWWRRTRLPG